MDALYLHFIIRLCQMFLYFWAIILWFVLKIALNRFFGSRLRHLFMFLLSFLGFIFLWGRTVSFSSILKHRLLIISVLRSCFTFFPQSLYSTIFFLRQTIFNLEFILFGRLFEHFWLWFLRKGQFQHLYIGKLWNLRLFLDLIRRSLFGKHSNFFYYCFNR